MSQGKPSHWKQVREVLDQALDLRPEARQAFIDARCPGTDLKRQVLSVLNAYESETLDFSPKARAEKSSETTEPQDSPPELYVPGSTIGPYRIEEKIGAGGMGAVFSATRSDETFDKKVALKVVQRRWASDDELRRFRSERQILADLSHPSIAQLLDGGNTPEGRPYLVMEYVEGVTIDTYCKRYHPTLDQRLDLFRQVCDAVQFAHQNLIVHRDLKPANILVNESGQVKLLDFGIAKVLDSSDFAMTVLETRPGSAPMTLAYASPEQVQGQAVTTATDVYALGLLLFELLTGERPYQFEGSNLIDAAEAICRRDVTSPSARLRGMSSSDGNDPGSNASPPPWRRIQGDLDAIVLKALAKDPRERYAGAGQMAEDLDRFQRFQPVRARQGTLVYRARKFLARNRAPIAVLATIFTILVASIALLASQGNELRRQRDQARTVSDWFARLFESPDPFRSYGATITARQLLDKGRASIEDELAGEPLVLGRLLQVLARTYLNLGSLDEAATLADRALGLEAPGEDPAEEFRLIALRTKVAFRQRQLPAALDFAEQGLALGPQVARLAPEAHVELLKYKAKSLLFLTKFEAAEKALLQALQQAEDVAAQEVVADLLISLSEVQNIRQKYSLALESAEQAIELMQDAESNLHPIALAAERHYAEIALEKIGFEESKRRLLDVIDRHRRLDADVSRNLVACYRTLAVICERSGHLEDAESYYRETLRIGQEAWGELHPDLLIAIENLAKVRLAAGDIAEAESLLRRALVIAAREPGKDSHPYGIALQLKGQIEAAKGETKNAETSYLEALERLEASVGPNHEHTVEILASLGFLRIQERRREEAESFLRQALERGLKAPERSAGLTRIIYYLALQEGKLDKPQAAVDHLQEVIDAHGSDGFGPQAFAWRSFYLLELERYDEAERDALRGEEALAQRNAEPWLLFCRQNRAVAQLGQGRIDEAIEVLANIVARHRELGTTGSVLERAESDLTAARETAAARAAE